MQTVQLQVSDEFKAVGDLLATLISDIKAKKTVAMIAADALPQLMAGLGGLASFSDDYKLVDNQAYLIRALLSALEPAPAPLPAA